METEKTDIPQSPVQNTSQNLSLKINNPRQKKLLPVIVCVIVGLLLISIELFYIISTKSRILPSINIHIRGIQLIPNPIGTTGIFPTPFLEPTKTENPQWDTYINQKDNYQFNYPTEWKFDTSATTSMICLGSEQSYIDFYCKGKMNIITPKTGFKSINIGLQPKGVVELAGSVNEALTWEGEGESIPLVNEQYLTINGIQAHRAYHQLKEGDLTYGEEKYTGPTLTQIEYNYYYEKNLYSLWFEIDSYTPEETIKIIDKVANTFKIINP